MENENTFIWTIRAGTKFLVSDFVNATLVDGGVTTEDIKATCGYFAIEPGEYSCYTPVGGGETMFVSYEEESKED